MSTLTTTLLRCAFAWTLVSLLSTAVYGQTTSNSCAGLGPANEWPVNASCTGVAMNTNGQSATYNPGGSCGSGNNDDVWAYFVATATSTNVDYTITGWSWWFGSCSSARAILHVFDGTCGSLNEVACDQSGSGTGSTASVTVATTIGTTYYVRVQRLNCNLNLTGDLCVYSTPPPPANDDCANASVIGNGVHAFSTLLSTGSDITSCTLGDTDDIWFEYTATCTGEVSLSTCDDADYDTSIGVFDACGGTEIACNDDGTGCTGFTSSLTFNALANETFLIRMSGYNGATGTGNLTVSCSPLIWYSQASGNTSGAIWDRLPVGTGGVAVFDEYSSVVVQNGHAVTQDVATMDMHELTIEGTGSFDLNGSNTIRVGGDLTVNGTLSTSTGTVLMHGPNAQDINGTALHEYHDLEIDNSNGVTVNTSDVHINGTLQLTDGNFDANGNEVVLLSDATGTARLGTVGATASYSGNLRVQRYISAGVTNWRLMSSPVSGITLSQWNGDFFTAGFPGSNYPTFDMPVGSGILWPSIREYDETDLGASTLDGLVGVGNINDLFTTGKGYAAWCGDNLVSTNAFTVDVTGAPNIASSPIAIPVSYTNTGAPTADGWNLVGNPLASPIDFGAISKGADIENNFWIFDPVSGNNVFWNETLGIGSGSMNGNIQSSQAFWLHAIGPATTTTVDESAKVLDPNGGTPFGGQQQPTAPIMTLTVHSQINQFSDETILHFGVGAGSTDASDMKKFIFSHNEAPQIMTESSDGDRMGLNAWGGITGSATIPVQVDVAVTGTYTIEVDDWTPQMDDHCVELEDLVTGMITTMMPGATYDFTIDANDPAAPARFLLHVSDYPNGGLTASALSGSVMDPISFNSSVDPGTSVMWDFGDGTTSADASTTHSYSLPGNYTVTLTVGDAPCELVFTEDIIISLSTSIEDVEADPISVWFANDLINLSWTATNEALLGYRILNMNGQEVDRNRIQLNTGVHSIDASGLSEGTYIIQCESDADVHSTRVVVHR